MSQQSTYGAPPVATPGLRVGANIGYSISRANGNTANPMPFGRMVRFKSGDEENSVSVLSATGAPFAGVVVWEPDFDRTTKLAAIAADTNGTVGPAIKESLTLQRIGLIWVEIEAAVKAGDKPFVRHTANGGNTMIGVFSNASGTGLDDITNLGTFIIGGAANTMALLALNLDAAQTQPTLPSGSPIVADITFTIGAEGGDAIAVTVQLKDLAGNNVAGQRLVHWWLTDAATVGTAVTADPPSGGTALSGTGVVSLKEDTAEVYGHAVTGSTGSLVITLTEAGVDAWYLWVACGDSAAKVSTVIQFA